MSASPPRVVFDCNIFVQALINRNGPAARCVELARKGEIALFVSPFVLLEIREIHFKTPPKYGITAEQTDELARAVAMFATIITDVPEVYLHPYDPDDSAYVNLALRADARLIVSRDRHLLMLVDSARSEARDFQARFRWAEARRQFKILGDKVSPEPFGGQAGLDRYRRLATGGTAGDTP